MNQQAEEIAAAVLAKSSYDNYDCQSNDFPEPNTPQIHPSRNHGSLVTEFWSRNSRTVHSESPRQKREFGAIDATLFSMAGLLFAGSVVYFATRSQDSKPTDFVRDSLHNKRESIPPPAPTSVKPKAPVGSMSPESRPKTLPTGPMALESRPTILATPTSEVVTTPRSSVGDSPGHPFLPRPSAFPKATFLGKEYETKTLLSKDEQVIEHTVVQAPDFSRSATNFPVVFSIPDHAELKQLENVTTMKQLNEVWTWSKNAEKWKDEGGDAQLAKDAAVAAKSLLKALPYFYGASDDPSPYEFDPGMYSKSIRTLSDMKLRASESRVYLKPQLAVVLADMIFRKSFKFGLRLDLQYPSSRVKFRVMMSFLCEMHKSLMTVDPDAALNLPPPPQQPALGIIAVGKRKGFTGTPITKGKPSVSFAGKGVPLANFDSEKRPTARMVFGNKRFGGGVLGNGYVQEEIDCLEHPELLGLIPLLCNLEQGEVMFVKGQSKYYNVRGYGRKAGEYGFSKDAEFGKKCGASRIDIDKLVQLDSRISSVYIDAVDLSSGRGSTDSRVAQEHVMKKLDTLFAAASSGRDWLFNYDRIIGGNLGCGAFKNPVPPIYLVQKAAAEKWKTDLVLCPFDEKDAYDFKEDFMTMSVDFDKMNKNLWEKCPLGSKNDKKDSWKGLVTLYKSGKLDS